MKLGDTVAAMTKAVGIEPCDACKERQRKLNDFGDKLRLSVETILSTIRGKNESGPRVERSE